MTEKKIISQLNKLKALSPDKTWQNSCRDVLVSQINNSGGRKLNAWQEFLISFKCVSNLAYRPVIVMASFFVILLVTSLFSYQLFSSSKPNDSLYIARVISERAKLNTVLDSRSKELLAAKFAMSHAKDISNILADPDFDFEANSKQVARLNDSFSKEIELARTKLTSLQETEESLPETSNEIISSSTSSPSYEDDIIFIADNHRDDKGLEVSFSEKDEEQEKEEKKDEVENDKTKLKEEIESDIEDLKESIKEKDESSLLDSLLDEALESYQEGDFKKAEKKINQAFNLID